MTTRVSRKLCPANDPYCPCQDGDACHYVDTEDTKAFPVPVDLLCKQDQLLIRQKEVASKLMLLKHELAQVGLYATMQKMEIPITECGYEIAQQMAGVLASRRLRRKRND